MSTKKAGRAVRVPLDAKTALKFESLLRNGLVSSNVVYFADNKKLKAKGSGKIQLRPAEAARMSEELRTRLAAAGTISKADKEALDKLTKKVK